MQTGKSLLLCRDHQALWLPAEPCRGAQLRQGAALAEHDILWFLHADAELDGQPLTALCQAVAEGANGGYFAFRFSGQPGWQGRLLERLVDWRNRLLALGFALGVTPQRLARLYAGRPRRER